MMKEPGKIPDKNPFRVPQGYFENLTERMTSISTSARIEKRSLVVRLRPYLLAAAGVAILAMVSLSVIHFTGTFKRNNPVSNATSSAYSSVYLDDIDLATLEDNASSGNYTFNGIPEVSGNDIIDYLSSEEINIFDIYEQL